MITAYNQYLTKPLSIFNNFNYRTPGKQPCSRHNYLYIGHHLYPIIDQNCLVSMPYPRLRFLKTIPFIAAHTHIGLYMEVPPPPRFCRLANNRFFMKLFSSISQLLHALLTLWVLDHPCELIIPNTFNNQMNALLTCIVSSLFLLTFRDSSLVWLSKKRLDSS